MMNCRLLIIGFFLVAILGYGNAAYDLCDLAEYALDENTFICNITSTKYTFSQQDIDRFWEQFQEDGSFDNNQVGIVQWKVKNATIQIADDLRFIQLDGMNLNWDLLMESDGNTVHDINQSIASGLRTQGYTAIKPSVGAFQNFLISFAPLGERKSLRNMTLEKAEGGFSVNISGNTLKRMEFDLEGNLTIKDSFIENIEFIKATEIVLDDFAYIENVGSIEAESISLDGTSFIRTVGNTGQNAIVVGQGDLSLAGNSYISDLLGNIVISSDINCIGAFS